MDIEKEISGSQVALLLAPSNELDDIISQHMKSLSKKTVCYITLSKTFDSLKEQFGKKKIKTDNVVFIDAISKSFKKMPDQTNGCYYVSSPSSLTELEIAALKVLRHGFNYLVFDSLSAMLVYQKNAPAARFVSALSNNARQNNAKAIFYAAKSEEQSQMIKDVGAVVDKVIDLGK